MNTHDNERRRCRSCVVLKKKNTALRARLRALECKRVVDVIDFC